MNGNPNRNVVWICFLLALATAALYWPVHGYEFINLDDPVYILQNPKVSQGLTWKGAVWAFTQFHGANWHPLTWISHMADVSLFGFKPAGHHLVNVAFHAANVLLLFLFMRQATGALWRSVAVAALFAWHPAHVESVAWVAERKDVLSTFFGLLSLIFYVRYAQKPSARPLGATKWNEGGSTLDYALTLVFFALGLMSKPMLVTWPFVMLLLDYWPLQRGSGVRGQVSGVRAQLSGSSDWLRLLREKLPFFALSVGSCVVTFLAQRGTAVQSLERITLSQRIENTFVAYARYIAKTFWPAEQSAYYPYPLEWPDETVAVSVMLIGAILLFTLWTIRTRRYLFWGTSWFLGTLVPVIGLVQVGGQSIADRYLYIPQIGLLVAAVWGISELVAQKPRARKAAIVIGILALLACGAATRRYLPYWQNSTLLFRHALEVESENTPAQYSFGVALSAEGKYHEAIPHLEYAAAANPDCQFYQAQLALALEGTGDVAGAIERYRNCLELNPHLVDVLNNLAWIYATTPKPEHRNGAEAIRLAQSACEKTDYEWPMFLGTLAAAYAEAGQFDLAVQSAERAEKMARQRGFTELADTNLRLLAEYRAGKPHREPGAVPPAPASVPPQN